MNIYNDISDTRILHDDYFSKRPAAYLLPAVRLVLLCVMAASFILIFCDIYGYSGDKTILAVIGACSAGLVYTLASLFPASLVYGGTIAAAAGFIWIFRDEADEVRTYFWDYMMIRLNSRLLKTGNFTIHNIYRLKSEFSPEYTRMTEAFMWAAIFLAVVFAVIFTASVRTRFRMSVPVTAVTLISAPAVASETAGFFMSYMVYLVCVLSFEAVLSSYELDNSFIFGSLAAARYSERRNDASYHRRTRFFILKRKLDHDAHRYHKYVPNLIAMACVTSAVFFTVSAVVPEGSGISYKKVFDTISSVSTSIMDNIGNMLGTSFGTADDKGYFSSDSYGSISNSISLEPPNSSDRPVLNAVLTRNDIPVYLRGDIGVDYTDGSWSGIKGYSQLYADAVSDEFYPETEYQVFRRYVTYVSPVSADELLPLQMISVQYLRNTRVVFQPLAAYELSFRNSDYYECFGDFILRTKRGFIKTYQSLALTPTFTESDFRTTPDAFDGSEIADLIYDDGTDSERELIEDGQISIPDMTNEFYLAQIDAYRSFINETYMRSNSKISRFVEQFRDYYTKTAGSEVWSSRELGPNALAYRRAQAMCDYFSENFTYSLDVDNGEDQLTGFLYDTNEGHCALFATAMTLAMRELGYPARYVTGYVVSGGGTPVEGGYSYTLTEKMLHAWVEVYFTGIGWLPFDPTAAVPGYSDTQHTETVTTPEDEKPASETTTSVTTPPTTPPVSSVSETESTTAPDTADSTEDTTREPEGGDEDNTEDYHKGREEGIADVIIRLLPFIAGAAVLAGAVIVIVLFFRNLKKAEENVLAGFGTLPPTDAAGVMYRFVLALLERKGLHPENEQFYDFAQRVDGSIEMKGSNLFLMDIMPVFEKCEFGNEEISPVTEQERQSVLGYTAGLYRKVMSDLPPLKRLFAKISLFL